MSNTNPLCTYNDMGDFGKRDYGSVDEYEASDSCLTVIHNRTTSTGDQPANIGVLADYCVEAFRNLGMSERRIDEQVIRLTFLRQADQEDFNEEANTAGDEWCGVCNSSQLGSMTFEHHIFLITNGGHEANDDEINLEEVMRCLTHELVHAAQAAKDTLHYTWFPVRGVCKIRFMDGNGIQKAWDDGVGSLDYYDRAWEWEAYAKQTNLMLTIFDTTSIRITNLVVENIRPETREDMFVGAWNAFIGGEVVSQASEQGQFLRTALCSRRARSC